MSLTLNRSTWKRITFGDLVANINDYFHPARDGALPYVAGPHMNPGEVAVADYGSTEDDDFPPTFKRKFQEGDVLLHSRGIEKLASVDRPGVTGEKLFVLRSKDADLLIQPFLVWLLLSRKARAHMQENFTGSVNKFLNWKPLAAMKVDLPPIEEQQRIADLLWAVERHRQSTGTAVAQIDRVAEEVFSHLLRASDAVPVPLPTLVEEMTVGVVVKPTQYYTDDAMGIPALRGLNVKPGGFELDDLVRFKPESAAQLTKSTLRLGDVVVVRTGRPGDAAVVTTEAAGFNCIDLIIARPGSELLAEFLALFLNSSFGREQITRLSAGTAQQHFNVGALKKLMVPGLTLPEQGQIVADIEAVREARGDAEREGVALATLRESLLADIFGGS